jgi:hypothetical protein
MAALSIGAQGCWMLYTPDAVALVAALVPNMGPTLIPE